MAYFILRISANRRPSPPRSSSCTAMTTCASPKLHPACIFNNFIKQLTARTGDAVHQLRRSRLLLPKAVVALPLAPAHPLQAINGCAIDGNTQSNFSRCAVDAYRLTRSRDLGTRAELSRSAFPHTEIATGYGWLSVLPQSSSPPPADGTPRHRSDHDP